MLCATTEGRSIDRRPVQVKRSRSSIDLRCGIAEATNTTARSRHSRRASGHVRLWYARQVTCHAGSPARPRFNRATANQRHEKEFLHVSNEETTTTEEPRAQALAMRAGGRKKAAAKKGGRKKGAPKKAGRKAAPKKKAAGRKKTAAKKGYRKTAAKKKGGRKAAPKKKAAGRKKSGGRKKAAAAAAPAADSMPSTSDSMC
jgi:hypothetical protein